MTTKCASSEYADSAKSRRPAYASALLAATVALITLLVFAGALNNQFVNWDDDRLICERFDWRGFSPAHLVWMFTSFTGEQYHPLTWLSLALDYKFWGMNPTGYHLTNLLLHLGCVTAFFYLARRLFALQREVSGEEKREPAWPLAAAFAALFFAIHPMRAETVGWATERRGLLSAFFYLLTILAYLRAVAPANASAAALPSKPRRGWHAASVSLALCALLSKPQAVTIPVILMLLDVYPLRRLGGKRGWLRPAAASAWLEKLPFFTMALAAVAIAPLAQGEAISPVSLPQRFAITAHGTIFYPLRSLLPLHLSPLYQRPTELNPWQWQFIASFAVAFVAAMLLWLNRRRAPALAAAAAAYAAIIAPMVGIVPLGDQMAADRYSYLSCLPFALLVGGAIRRGVVAGETPRFHRASRGYAVLAAAVIFLALGILANQQSHIWRNGYLLWRQARALDPNSSMAANNLGYNLSRQEQLEAALISYNAAIEHDPKNQNAYNNRGVIHFFLGNREQEITDLEFAVKLRGDDYKARLNLGLSLMNYGDLDRAIAEFRRGIELNPKYAKLYVLLGRALRLHGQYPEAIATLTTAIELTPGLPMAYLERALCHEQTGDYSRALADAAIAEPELGWDNELHGLLLRLRRAPSPE